MRRRDNVLENEKAQGELETAEAKMSARALVLAI
jgi:hypothetical protein